MFVIHVSSLFKPGVHADRRGKRSEDGALGNEGALLKKAYIGRRKEKGREGGKEGRKKK